MQWDNRWPVRVDIRRDARHQPNVNTVALARSPFVPRPAIICDAGQGKQLISGDQPRTISVAVRAFHVAVVAREEEDAAAFVEASIAALKQEAEAGGGGSRLAEVAQKAETLSAAVVTLRESKTAPMRITLEREFEDRDLPEGADGWWNDSPVFILADDEEVTDVPDKRAQEAEAEVAALAKAG